MAISPRFTAQRNIFRIVAKVRRAVAVRSSIVSISWLTSRRVLAGAAGGRAPGEVTPLFRDEAPLAVTISGPIRLMAARAQRSTDLHDGTMAADGATYHIELSARRCRAASG